MSALPRVTMLVSVKLPDLRCKRFSFGDLGMKNDLIFDLGMHLGEDTDFYLKKGYRVVGVEANPTNVKECMARFEAQILQGKLHIISGAVVSNRNEGFVTFYQNVKSNWGTVEKDWAIRNLKLGKPSVEIKVPIVDILSLVSQHGTPHYMKIDLQGQELTVLSLLKALASIPQHVSLNMAVWDNIIIKKIGSSSPTSEKMDFTKVDFNSLIRVLDTFTELGYAKFKVVQQATIPGMTIRTHDLNGVQFDYTFERHSSGPFGNEIAGKWVSYREAVELYLYQARNRGWFDIHAAL
jgi:FkbM family methyltransferase